MGKYISFDTVATVWGPETLRPTSPVDVLLNRLLGCEWTGGAREGGGFTVTCFYEASTGDAPGTEDIALRELTREPSAPSMRFIALARARVEVAPEVEGDTFKVAVSSTPGRVIIRLGFVWIGATAARVAESVDPFLCSFRNIFRTSSECPLVVVTGDGVT